MNNLKTIDKMNASGMTTFLKNDVGNGSMKNGIKLLLMNKKPASISNSIIFFFFGWRIDKWSSNVFWHKLFSNEKETKEYIKTIDLNKHIDHISENEAEEIVENIIKEKEVSLDKFDIYKLNHIEYLATCYMKDFTKSNNRDEISIMQNGLDWVINIVIGAKKKKTILLSDLYYNQRLDKCIDKLIRHKEYINTQIIN